MKHLKLNKSIFIIGIILIAIVTISFKLETQDSSSAPMKTGLIRKPTAIIEAWGKSFPFTSDSTETFGLNNAMSGIAEINPGEQIHPPHQHEEEEFMLILEGEGTWSISGKESKAIEGDIMYSSPWDWHGITNTGKDTLKFYFVKWNSKGVEKMKQPK